MTSKPAKTTVYEEHTYSGDPNYVLAHYISDAYNMLKNNWSYWSKHGSLVQTARAETFEENGYAKHANEACKTWFIE